MKKNVVLGVTGGIACYKALEIVSMLAKKDINVDVIMTESACEFVTPLAFQTLSKNRVVSDMFDAPKFWEVEHISLAQKADLFVIAPATANCIGKLASGIADDMLTTVAMAVTCPVLIAPAMNTAMYENEIYNENAAKLKAHGYHFIDAAEGLLACGDTGKGKLPDPGRIVDTILSMLAGTEDTPSGLSDPKDLNGKKVLITAGPTIEPIDPVRYISNHSSGKMGFAIAESANRRGAYVVLVAGPVNLSCSEDILRIDVETAAEMSKQVNRYYGDADIVIKAAAVSDYRPTEVSSVKIKKNNQDMRIHLVKNEDILEGLGKKKTHQILVGFAAETNDVENYAKEKIAKKNLDMIVANNVAQEGAGFKGDTNIISIITKDGAVHKYPIMSKDRAAETILVFLPYHY